MSVLGQVPSFSLVDISLRRDSFRVMSPLQSCSVRCLPPLIALDLGRLPTQPRRGVFVMSFLLKLV